MDEAHLISGDPFFENNELPLGTITVWEMHAPEGYLVDTVTPVSYTHLDVYKRQGYDIAKRRSDQSC